MERYRYEPGDITDERWGEDANGDDLLLSVNLTGFLIFDSLRGHVDDMHIAFTTSRDDAEKIVDALNASVRNGR